MVFRAFDDAASRNVSHWELPEKSFGGVDLDSNAEIKSPRRKAIVNARSCDNEPICIG